MGHQDFGPSAGGRQHAPRPDGSRPIDALHVAPQRRGVLTPARWWPPRGTNNTIGITPDASLPQCPRMEAGSSRVYLPGVKAWNLKEN
jgi:hypothetical protein